MRRLTLLTVVFCCGLLMSCESRDGKTIKHFDHAAAELPFVRPVLKIVDTFPDAPPLSKRAQEEVNLQRAFFAGDFPLLEKSLNQAHERYVQGQTKDDEAGRFIDRLKGTQLAGINICTDWVAALPDSYVAHWVCGAMWHEGAWIARSGEFANKVTPIRFALMRERFERSDELLAKAVTLSSRPVEALTLLATNRMMLGDKEAATTLLQRAKTAMPTYSPLYGTQMNYLLPEWGGSAEQIAQVMNDAKEAGVDEDALLYFHDVFVVRPEKMSNPGEEKAYWERVIAEKSTFDRLKALVQYYQRVHNWRDSIPAASQLIEAFPDDPDAYEMRAEANQKLGNMPAALNDYRLAAAQGKNYAIQTLIQAFIQGALGLPAKNWDALDKACHYGAALGSAAAANCMGSLSRDGSAVSSLFHNDIPQSFAWHLFAARAGYHNSQYDLGWLLLAERAPGVKPEQAKSSGLFWLRRAAELDHQFAKKKLQEGGYAESEEIEESPSSLRRIVDVVRQFLL